MDEALVPTVQRLKIKRSNFRLLLDIKSKESTLQLVYDVLRRCPLFNTFLVTADGLYHKTDIDYAYLMWEDFVYQVEHKNQKKSNEMYYPRFIKAIIHHFMSKDPLIPKRNKFGALLPIELTNDEIRNSKAYKEYYTIATRKVAPKPKASVRRTKSSSDTSITPPTTAASPRLKASTKGKQTAKASKAKSLSALSEFAMTKAQQLKLVTKQSMQQTHISQPTGSVTDKRTGSKPGLPDVPTDESEAELSWNSTDDEGDDNEGKDDDDDVEDKGDNGEEGNGDDDDDADQEVVRDDDKDNDEEGGDDEHESDEETREEERFDHIPQTPEDSEDEGDGEEDLGLNIGMESIFETTSQLDVPTPSSVAPLPITTPIMTSSTIATTTTSQAPILPTIILSDIIQNLPSFGSLFRFDDRLNWLCEEAQRENDEFLRIVDENIKKIIKEQVKEQVKAQVFKILPKDYIFFSNKGSRPALSISKMKAAHYPDFGLKLPVPKQMWIDEVCTYDISVTYVVFPVNNNERKIRRFNEVYKFSDGTLTRIPEALDYRIKEYRVNRLNLGMNTWFWTAKDVTRSKEFIRSIEQRLKTRRIF
nr:hypothetical protein [Tanacetum cinerariifolium]